MDWDQGKDEVCVYEPTGDGVGTDNGAEQRWESEHEPIGGGAGMDTG